LQIESFPCLPIVLSIRRFAQVHAGIPEPHKTPPTNYLEDNHRQGTPTYLLLLNRKLPLTHNAQETLNARTHYGSSEDDGAAVHRINQYTIKQEIGRGSFGAVHLAVDQFGNEYAVKEFSKSRLRKRAQSNLLRRPNQRRQPFHRMSTADKLAPQANNSLDLIKEEIAIMKKLHHNNLVALIEVLDDPEEDSLYMVLEMCKKGVVMKVGIDDRADPYDEETCRCWFRDMILGIEYRKKAGLRKSTKTHD
jgi:[calcium/calmodulin-dependent protein kinase] kinase